MADSNNETTERLENVSKKIRHCAFCLKICEIAKLCGKCHRRAYCSKDCQKKDWNVLCGQGHKNWCDLQCAEEDLVNSEIE
jgi:hypothetical protein